jgi:subtilisin family serine protease
MPMIGVDCFVMVVPDGRSTNAAADQVSHDAEVAWAQPVALYGARAAAPAHKDPLFPAEPAARQWHLADLHRIATGRGVKVAVVDSGIEVSHPDLSGQFLVNRNFVAGQPLAIEVHGTGVAGIIAAKADNGIGIAGIAPRARLLGLRACWQANRTSTLCDSLSLAKAIYFAIQSRADVINLSLSGPDDRLLRELLKVALSKGSTIVTAFDQKRTGGGFPAAMPGVIAVSDSALAPPHGRAYTAPGRDIPTTEPGGRWFLVNGSSYAAAHVSGLVALMRERRRSAALVLVPRGGGMIDACASLLRVASACDCACGPSRLANAPAVRTGD